MTIVSHFFWSWYLFRNRSWVRRFACAAVAPDVPYLVLLAYYSLRFQVNGLADLRTWDLAWRSPMVCALHSFVPWIVIALPVTWFGSTQLRRMLLPVWGGWLSHIVVDMFTHRSDGYPIFYPLSTFRFPAPVSYWEPAYHGRTFMLIDTTLILVLLLHYLVTRRRRTVRGHLAAARLGVSSAGR